MIIAMTQLVPQDGRREAMLEVLQFVGNRVAHTPDCVSSVSYEAVGERGEILYVEHWDSERRLESHIRSALYLRLMNAFELASEPPKVSFHTVSMTRSLAFVEELRRKPASEWKR
jgi:quinol monooxygenase YgiN